MRLVAAELVDSMSEYRVPRLTDLPDIDYLEHLTSALYLDRKQDLALYLSVMDRLSVQAEAPGESLKILADYAKKA